MSISQNFPEEGPSLNLNFAGSRRLDPRITFTRSSSGTYLDENGLVTNASNDIPRFDHLYTGTEIQSLGLLVEESRTNFLLYSEVFNTGWSNITDFSITSNAAVSPDGILDTQQITNNSNTNNFNFTFQNYTTSTKGKYAYSIFVKDNNISNIDLLIGTESYGAGSNYSRCRYVFSTKSFTVADYVGTSSNWISSVSYVEYPNNWIRLIVLFDTTSFTTQTVLSMGFYAGLAGSTSSSYLKSFYVWGAQLESGAFSTSYIPTTTSTVTRSADNAVMTGTNFANWYNTLEGSLFAAARINGLGGGTYPGITYIDDGTQNNCIGFYVNDAFDDKIGAEAYVSGGVQYGFGSISAIVPFQLNRVISTYKVNDFAAAFSMGGTVGTDTAGSVPTVNRLIIGDLRGGSSKLNGTIAQILYYPKRLTNDQLQTLTR